MGPFANNDNLSKEKEVVMHKKSIDICPIADRAVKSKLTPCMSMMNRAQNLHSIIRKEAWKNERKENN